MLMEKNTEIAPEGTKMQSQSRNNTQFWRCLEVKVKKDVLNNKII